MEVFLINQPGVVVIRRGKILRTKAKRVRIVRADVIQNLSAADSLVKAPESDFVIAVGADCVWEKDRDGTWGFCITSGKVTYRGYGAASGMRRFRLRSRGGRAGSYGSTYSVSYAPGWIGKSTVQADPNTPDVEWQTYGSTNLVPVPANTSKTFDDPPRTLECAPTRSASKRVRTLIRVDAETRVVNPNGAVLRPGLRVLIPGATVTVGTIQVPTPILLAPGISVTPLGSTIWSPVQVRDAGGTYLSAFLLQGTLAFQGPAVPPTSGLTRRRAWTRSIGGNASTRGTRYTITRIPGEAATRITVEEGIVEWDSRRGTTHPLCKDPTPTCTKSSDVFPD